MGTPLEATRIEEAAENKVAYSLKLTQECVEAIEHAMSSKLPITFSKRPQSTVLVIGSGEKAQRFHVRSIPVFQEEWTAVEHDEETDRYKMLTDVKAKFQVQATARALTDFRAKNQPSAEEKERLKTKNLVEVQPQNNRMTHAKGSEEKQAFKTKKLVEGQPQNNRMTPSKGSEEKQAFKTKKLVEGQPQNNRMTPAKGSEEKQAFKAKKAVGRQKHSEATSDEPTRAIINNDVSFEPTLTMRALCELAKKSVRRSNIQPSPWAKYRPKEKSAPISVTPAKLIRSNEVDPGVDEPNRRLRGRSPTAANKRSRPEEEQTRRHDDCRSPLRRGNVHQRSRTRSPLVKRNRISSPLVSHPSPRRNSLSRSPLVKRNRNSSPLVSHPSPRRNSLSRSGPRRRFVSPQRSGRSLDRERENRLVEERDVDMRKPKTESMTDKRKKGCEADLHGYVPPPTRISSLEETKKMRSAERETVASTKDDRTTNPKSSPAVNWDQLLSKLNDSEVRDVFVRSFLPRLVPGFQFRVQGAEEEWRPTQKNGS